LSGERKGQLSREALEALQAHPPFDRMSEEALEWIGSRAALAYFPEGAEIVGPASGPVRSLYIVRQGVVHVRGSSGMPPEALEDLVHGSGECFPVGALLGRRATPYHYVAAGDVFAYELAREDFERLLDLSQPFRAFCTDHVSALLHRSRQLLHMRAAETLTDQAQMLAPLRSVGHFPALSCAPATPIREVLETMHRKRVGSMVVVDERAAPVGIFTQSDVLHRVALAQRDLGAPIAEVMTLRAHTLEASAPVHAAVFAMIQHQLRHIVLVEDGKAVGVVSERDLFVLQGRSLNRSAGSIRDASDYDALAEASSQVRQLTGRLLAHGMGVEEVTAVITSLNDSIVQRAIAIAADRHGVRGRYCWLAFGSEGRMEQTLSTDQDNGLIVEDGLSPQAFLPFANEVNQALDRCGFPLCKGGIMAGNVLWCLTLGGWRERFSQWIRNPLPQALLKAAIFFDFRPLAGEPDFAGELREHLGREAAGNHAFLRAMAENALETRPPLGFFGEFEVDKRAGVFAETLNLKLLGTRPFVDAARVWSLASARMETATVERLRNAATAGSLPRGEADAAVQAFHFVQSLRLRHQFFDNPQADAQNLVRPDALNSIDRRILKEAFRQASRLQQRLRMDFAL